MLGMDQILACVEISWSNYEFLGLNNLLGICLGTQGLIIMELGLIIVVWINLSVKHYLQVKFPEDYIIR